MNHKFVEFIPEVIEENTLYISIEYGTAVHKCACGCGEEVVTPITPKDWCFLFDGDSISLYPSIGNWSFDCQSHYWIKDNQIKWARKWSKAEIKAGRGQSDLNMKMYYQEEGQANETSSLKNLYKWLKSILWS